jgi:hypothetical protein
MTTEFDLDAAVLRRAPRVSIAWCEPSVDRFLLQHHEDVPPTVGADELRARLAKHADVSLAGLHDQAVERARGFGDVGQASGIGLFEIVESMRDAVRRFKGLRDSPRL